ncbi:MAG: hypothetical protein ACTHNS_03690 [Marmoricola sp.]
MNTVSWIVIAVIVLVIVIGAIFFLGRKARTVRDNRARGKADELRATALEKEGEVRRHQATADEVEARARRAQAEAEQKQAEAARLTEDARERRGVADDRLAEHQQQLQEADRVDPDVDYSDGDAPRQGPLDQDTIGEQGGTHRA